MSKIELEVGKWYRRRDGEIVYCFAKNPVGVTYPFHLCCEDGTFETCNDEGDFCDEADDEDEDIVEHLPDCTGFDWVPPKPIEPPPGWRLLTEGETVRVGDMAWDDKGFWDDELLSLEQKIIGQKWNAKDHYPIARKILQLREGAWYEREDGEVVGPCKLYAGAVMLGLVAKWRIDPLWYDDHGQNTDPKYRLIREVDPPKPKCRAFKWEERNQMRGLWIQFLVDGRLKEMQVAWFEEGPCGTYSVNGYRGEWLFENAKLLDGTPFGVLDDGT